MKWNKPDTEIQILYDLIYMGNIKKLNSQQSRMMVAKSSGWEEWGDVDQKVQAIR